MGEVQGHERLEHIAGGNCCHDSLFSTGNSTSVTNSIRSTFVWRGTYLAVLHRHLQSAHWRNEIRHDDGPAWRGRGMANQGSGQETGGGGCTATILAEQTGRSNGAAGRVY